jgi:CRISPR/Cas system CSM-associated protein Csm2 small subunit
MKNYETLKSLIDGAMPVVEIWKAETPAQEVWKEKWLRQAREVVDKPKEYCTCEGGILKPVLALKENGTLKCLECLKPIKTEKIDQISGEDKHIVEVISKLNEVIDHINKKGV